MNDPHDPLAQSLAEEASDLPARAARAARQRNAQRRRNRERLAQAAVLSLLGVITWNLIPIQIAPPSTVAEHSHGVTAPGISTEPDAPIARPFAPPLASVKVVPAVLPLPSGLDEEQAKFVKAVGDVPMLFVRNVSGKVTRIHIVER